MSVQAQSGKRLLRIALMAGAMMGAVAPSAIYAQARVYDIEASSLSRALKEFGKATGHHLLFQESLVRGKAAPALKGSYEIGDALSRLLAGSGLHAVRTSNGAIMIRSLSEGSSAGEIEAGSAPADDESAAIVVTGSRIERAGFNQPTPTTVIGAAELRQGARQNLAAVLNDSPQFRPSTSSQTTPGQTTSGTAPVDLRGLGAPRTLTLLNGRRFVGQNNLNYVPINLVERVEVVTGGASAAYGSDAVAGVVNIVLKEKLDGLSIGGQTGISSRGDGMRYGADATFGTSFADGRGHVLLGAEYVNEKGIPDRNSRRNLGSAGIVPVDPSNPGAGVILVRDVNDSNRSSAGLITSGILAGQTFNDDGTLRPFRGGTFASSTPAQMVGGEDGVALTDRLAATTPLNRINTFGRVSYDLGGATAWAEASYGRSESDYAFLPDIGVSPALTISASNPFLSTSVRNQLTAAGQTSFTFGKLFDGPFQLRYAPVREQYEGAVGIEGEIAKGWKFNAHYSHGEIHSRLRLGNARVVSRFNNAINAVSSNGQIVCAINADASTANDDAACRPLNPFGQNNASPEALDYITDTQRSDLTTKLDSVAGQIQGDLFSLWAGPITVAFGAEARWEEQRQRSGALDMAGAFGPLNLYGSPVQGGFNVKEGFAEVVLPVFDADSVAKLDLNGAARYSDYSLSGGIWSWKVGGTARLFDSLLFRATQSRDIRAPRIDDLFSARGLSLQTVNDQDTAGRIGIPGYNPLQPLVRITVGGNPDLQPEVSKTTTFGVTFSPSFLRGLNLSVDYYDIKIKGAIATLSGTNLTLACRNGSAAACARITRDPTTQNVVAIEANAQNIASFQTRGLDFEASYAFQLSTLSDRVPGSLRIRALATYVKNFIFDTGVSRVDSAGDVGETGLNALPKWRGLLSLAYQGDRFGADARVRYVGGGLYDQQVPLLVNNKINSRTYVDIGARFKIMDQFEIFGNVNNVFDRKPPLSVFQNVFYDVIGTYFTAGARVNF
jgi:iron complex outermembrane receptor protein